MLELKFKAWDKVKMKMLRPLGITFDTQSLAPFAVSVPGRSWEPIHKYELLQFTGLSDKNAVEVYQGDLFNIDSILYRVIWDKASASFRLQSVKSSSSRDLSVVSGEVIQGNVYQNRELLG